LPLVLCGNCMWWWCLDCYMTLNLWSEVVVYRSMFCDASGRILFIFWGVCVICFCVCIWCSWTYLLYMYMYMYISYYLVLLSLSTVCVFANMFGVVSTRGMGYMAWILFRLHSLGGVFCLLHLLSGYCEHTTYSLGGVFCLLHSLDGHCVLYVPWLSGSELWFMHNVFFM